MIYFRNWEKWQGGWLAEVRRLRKFRGTDPEAPYSLPAVRIESQLNSRFQRFAVKLGGTDPEGYLTRALQYAGIHRPFQGAIDVERDLFGPLVLSRPWHQINPEDGARIYDLLLETGICVRKRPRTPSRRRRVANRKPTGGPPVVDDPGSGPGTDPDPEGSPPRPPPGGAGGSRKGRERKPKAAPEGEGPGILGMEGPPYNPCPACTDGAVWKDGEIVATCRKCARGRDRAKIIHASRQAERESDARREADSQTPRSTDPEPRRLGDDVAQVLEQAKPEDG